MFEPSSDLTLTFKPCSEHCASQTTTPQAKPNVRPRGRLHSTSALPTHITYIIHTTYMRACPACSCKQAAGNGRQADTRQPVFAQHLTRSVRLVSKPRANSGWAFRAFLGRFSSLYASVICAFYTRAGRGNIQQSTANRQQPTGAGRSTTGERSAPSVVALLYTRR